MNTLTVNNLSTHFFTRAGVVKAVDDVSLHVGAGEVLGLVGESGSGKSVLGFSILGLIDAPGRIVSGGVDLCGNDLRSLPARELRRLRGSRAEMVGISAAATRMRQYPHQLSGGMRQRVAIAIAMLLNPDLIIADEPTTALDVTVQAQILFEMQRLCRERGKSLIWISHDLAVIAEIADRVAVMYAGKIVEQGRVDDVLDRPAHPYTRGLLDSIPGVQARGEPLAAIPGITPSPLDLPAGCAFRRRCPRADARCESAPSEAPAPGGRRYRCWHPRLGIL